MYSFNNDYSEAAHPAVMAALASTAAMASTGAHPQQFAGYGCDDAHTARAAGIIRDHIGKTAAEADVHFLVGGTQTNLITITGSLRPWEAVVSCELGHIAVHETGAIEAAGHKVITVPSASGKMTPAMVENVLASHTSEHMVVPRMVYISNTTEIGSQYSRAELAALSALCRSKELLLFMDGARLGSALASTTNDLTMRDIAELTDVFYIGATKNGALFGEALVVMTPVLRPQLRYLIKQRGALLAKGWIIAAQFAALFTDGLFYTVAEHANRMSCILRDGVLECGYELLCESHSNQQFILFPPEIVASLKKQFVFTIDSPVPDGRLLVRLCTSWATAEDQCHRFVQVLKSFGSSDGGRTTSADCGVKRNRAECEVVHS